MNSENDFVVSKIEIDNIIYINVHMEQVYTDFVLENERNDSYNRNQDFQLNYMQINNLTYNTVIRISNFIEKQSDKVIVLDFQNSYLKNIQNNISNRILDLIGNNVKVINLSAELSNKLDGLKEHSDFETDYYVAFKSKQYSCIRGITENKEYECANGVILSKYVDVKRIIEDNTMFFVWCYILCYNMVENSKFRKLCQKDSTKPVLLAHTLNGACIATMISKMMNLKMVYIDHLGPHNRITGINFPEKFEPYQNYLLVVDFVCQGNEVLRAQNIVEFIGGKYIGFIGMMKLDISQISNNETDIIKEVVVNIKPKDAIEELDYTIHTRLSR